MLRRGREPDRTHHTHQEDGDMSSRRIDHRSERASSPGGVYSGTLVAERSAGAVIGRPALALTSLQRIILAMAGIGILTASAYVSVPFFPVPLTMQTLAVLLLGGLLGPTVAASSVAGYLAIGATGAPVFHNGLGGLAVLAGPTAGYLIGFIPAALIMGFAVRWARKSSAEGRLDGWLAFGFLVAGTVLASAVIYAVGVPWLAVFTGQGLQKATAIGAVPFLLGDALKAAVAIGAIRMGGDALARRGLLLH
jgi:biotin transport system substrate-specific component